MTHNYQTPEVLEIGMAQEVILGAKILPPPDPQGELFPPVDPLNIED